MIKISKKKNDFQASSLFLLVLDSVAVRNVRKVCIAHFWKYFHTDRKGPYFKNDCIILEYSLIISWIRDRSHSSQKMI